ASKHASQSRRLLSLAAVLDGMDRAEAARIGGMDRQTLRDWVHRFNALGPDGLRDIRFKGHPPRLSKAQLAELAEIVETGPDRRVHGVVRWRRLDLRKVVADRFGVAYHERTIGKILKVIGFSHISARPRHPGQDPEVMEDFKKTSRTLNAHVGHLPKGRRIEVWFQCMVHLRFARRNDGPEDPASAYPACLRADHARATMGAAGMRSLQDDQIL
ncbi:winged helix-turn-helix domain-containing protein, partial [Xanthobacter flavus]